MNMKPKHPTIAVSPVKSSQIHGLGYDATTKTMAVQFKSKDGPGSIYHYANVSPEQFSTFQGAESIGKHFGAHFKKNDKHPFAKIPQD